MPTFLEPLEQLVAIATALADASSTANYASNLVAAAATSWTSPTICGAALPSHAATVAYPSPITATTTSATSPSRAAVLE